MNNLSGLELLFLNVFLEQLGLPIPSTPALIIAGAAIYKGTMPVEQVLLLAFLATTIPNILWYYAGKFYGNRIMGTLCRLSLTPESCVRETTSTFSRWGVVALLVSKFIPGFATMAAPLSGALKIPLFKFIIFNSLGILVWLMASILVGYTFHHLVQDILDYMMKFGAVAFPIGLGLLGVFLGYKWWGRNRFLKTIEMERISVQELKQLQGTGVKYSVLEIRNAPTSDEVAIRGARVISFSDIDENKINLDSEDEIVTYCHCPSEASAAIAAEKLKSKGYKKVRPLKGGAEAWLST